MSAKRTFKWLGLIFLICIIALVAYMYPFIKATWFTFEPVPFDSNLTIVYGGGGNSGILTSDSAVLVIDTKLGNTKKMYELVKQKAGNKPIIVVNTHLHMDHTGGNKLYKGSTIIAGAYDTAEWKHQNGTQGTPTVWLTDSMTLHIGKETVTLLNVGAAHTTNDVVVYLHNRKLLFTGDLVFANIHPVLNTKSGCDPERWITVLHMLQDRFAINTLMPGHGVMGNDDELKNFTRYMEDMKAAAADDSKVDDARVRYIDYQSLPFISSFHKVLDYWKQHGTKK